MENFTFYSPTYFSFGKDAENDTGKLVKRFGGSKVLISLGMPKNFEELGARDEDIPRLVDTLCNGNGRKGSIGGFVTLNEEDCTKIYRMMI